MERDKHMFSRILAIVLGGLAVLALLVAGGTSVLAQSKGKPTGPTTPRNPAADQVIHGFPMTITVSDDTQMDIRYTNAALGQDETQQFYGGNAEGTYLWVNVGGTVMVFGPPIVPAGNNANGYTTVSNTLSGSGTPSDPWVVTTVNLVPGTNLRLTQHTSYVNGAEFVALHFTLEQLAGTVPVTATLFHAADLYTGNSDSGFGYYDSSSGAVGDYYTVTNNVALYQTFVPSSPSSAYQEDYYNTIWDNIGSTSGPGPGFQDTIIANTQHDSGAGLQWNLTVPPTGSVTVGDTDLFSTHAQLCGAFSDVHYGDYYYDYIYYLACHGIVSGYSDTTFRPGNNATRGQLSKMVTLGMQWTIDTSGGPHFQDVPSTNPFYQYIETAYHHNVINGYPCNLVPTEPCVPPGNLPYFRWGANVTRGQTMKIIVLAKGWPINTTGGPHFNDVPPGSTFYDYVETGVNKGIIGGYNDGTFRPGNNVTRGQISKILYLALMSALNR